MITNPEEVKTLKELYSAPEAKLTCFAAIERIAALNFNDFFGGSVTLQGESQASVKNGDIKLN